MKMYPVFLNLQGHGAQLKVGAKPRVIEGTAKGDKFVGWLSAHDRVEAAKVVQEVAGKAIANSGRFHKSKFEEV